MADIESWIRDRPAPFLAGGGQMAVEIARHSWAATSLGPIERWPPALKVAAGMMLNSAFPKCLCWGPDLVAIYNDAFVPILGDKHPCVGRSFRDIWAEAWADLAPLAERAMGGEAVFLEDLPLRIRRSDRFEDAHFTFCYSPVRDENGVIRGMLDTVIETTGKVRAEQLGILRNRELVHRSRNAYTLVAALVRQAFRASASMDEAQDRITNRLAGLVRAQDVLAALPKAEGTVGEVVCRALTPFRDGGRQIEAQGPPVPLHRERVASLALALHELATNAAKYGALSVGEGRVRVSWRVVPEGDAQAFVLDWVESGGPEVREPTRHGFGSLLVRQSLETEFGGTVEIAYPPEGLRFSLRAPYT